MYLFQIVLLDSNKTKIVSFNIYYNIFKECTKDLYMININSEKSDILKYIVDKTTFS